MTLVSGPVSAGLRDGGNSEVASLNRSPFRLTKSPKDRGSTLTLPFTVEIGFSGTFDTKLPPIVSFRSQLSCSYERGTTEVIVSLESQCYFVDTSIPCDAESPSKVSLRAV